MLNATSLIMLIVVAAGFFLAESSIVVRSGRQWKVRRSGPVAELKKKFYATSITADGQASQAGVSAVLRKQQIRTAIDSVAASLNWSMREDVASPHFEHTGKSTAFQVPYEVRNGSRGLGLFLTKDVPKGQKVWTFRPGDNFKFYKSDMHVLQGLLEKAPEDVAKWLVRWSYQDLKYEDDCMLLELEDGRFTNDANGATATMVASSNGNAMEAASHLSRGTELLEDYSEDGLNDLSHWWQPVWDKYGKDDYQN
mmetsp:Transcript_106771/g.189771  ORF Transcript_106771/g.189771 Transcript_106771/m.189771 type:complete len:253 (-) Transcript_106771:184-942(-)|eukprot:CAMPEP_0197637544 /NCGR_PEP_ID=MMETSP1338-20131121/12739_1 /TAXON_ID=43686 ORGANISM="Pelagodinium beii, Strain RCC1491" /NCGR_SAMPLE_ID=MMETSP1338 /ASSEMBLY_ACC=CAM_ASM_000754 /LENGTH=252 /DNA_ID=CAMNT_0043209977 /DNA_START=66 /DNA_END=824 /DNA_ORIENTATION=-